jgi:hypothetical protein
MKYHGSIEFTLIIQKATNHLICRRDIAEFKAKFSDMTFALNLTNHEK